MLSIDRDTHPRAAVVMHIDVTRAARASQLLRVVDYAIVYFSATTASACLFSLASSLESGSLYLMLGNVSLLASAAIAAYLAYRGPRAFDPALVWSLSYLLTLCPALVAFGFIDADRPLPAVALVMGITAMLGLLGLLWLHQTPVKPFAVNMPHLIGRLRAHLITTSHARRPLRRFMSLRGLTLTGFGLVAVIIGVQAVALNMIAHFGCYLLIRARRHFLAPASQLLASDTRPPVLFLRSFDDDEKLGLHTSPNKALLDYSLEDRLAHHFSAMGPFIAIGSPKERLPLPGAARAQLADDQWQAQVLQWMRDARLIVMYSGKTHWVNWELRRIVEQKRSSDLILLIPENKSWRKNKRSADLEARVQQLRETFRDTPWAEELEQISDYTDVRAMLFRPDGSMVMISSHARCRDSYHLAALVAHLILLEPEAAAEAAPKGGMALPRSGLAASLSSWRAWVLVAVLLLSGTVIAGARDESRAEEYVRALEKNADADVASGQLERAQVAYKSILQLAEASHYRKYRAHMSRAYLMRGFVLQRLGKLNEAADSLASGAALTVELADQRPNDPTPQRLAATAFQALGACRMVQKKFSDAQSAFQNEVVFAERATQTVGSGWKDDLALGEAHVNLGTAFKLEGMLDRAEAELQAGVTNHKTLSTDMPAERDVQRVLLVAYNKLGAVQVERGHRPEALATYTSALELALKRRGDPDALQAVDLAYRQLARVMLDMTSADSESD